MIEDPVASSHLNNPLLDRVQRFGLLPFLRSVRSGLRREVSRWIRRGCPSPAPEIVKTSIVKSYVVRSKARVFVETGTLIGGMVEIIARLGVKCYTIEIDEAYNKRARSVLGNRSNIEFLLGDSGVVMPQLLAKLDEPAVFWLDGHYSGGATGKGEADTPISDELNAILNHPLKTHIILIDDAREFTDQHDYPALSSLLARFDDNPHYEAEVSADIIRITPRPLQLRSR